MKKNRLAGLLLSFAMVLPLCVQASASITPPGSAEKDYLQKGDYFSIYPAKDPAGHAMKYTTYSLTAERNAGNQVGRYSKIQLWNIGTGKWCVQRISNGVFAVMYVENREDHAGGSTGNSPKYWALNGNKTNSGNNLHMWEDDDANDDEKTFYLEDDHDGDPETFYICSAWAYKKGGARYVVPSSNDWKQGTFLQLSDFGYSWRITVHSRVADGSDNAGWMGRLDGNLYLSSVNLPGTHDSATANVNAVYAENANNYTCQQHFIHEQLINGVRAFDIRYCKNGDKVYTCHGSGDLRCNIPEYQGNDRMTIEWVMDKMTAFLDSHKTETIVMVVKQDDSNGDAPGVMASTLLGYKDYLYDWSSASPKLSQVRGKIVVMSRSDFSKVTSDYKYLGPNLSNWDDAYEDNDHWAQKIGSSGDPVEVYIQDDYNCTDGNKKTQVENVIRQLNGQQSSTGDAKNAPDIPETAFCFNYTSKAYADLDPNPLGSARVMNAWLVSSASKYFANGGYRTGITMMDYCDELLCDLVIASNAGRNAHTCTFDDVTVNDWFHDDVEKAAELGLVNGTSDTTFSPREPMKSAMAVQILYNREGCPEVELEAGFDPDVWYSEAVSWGIQQGIIHADSFDPDQAMPRQDMMLMMYNYANVKDYDTSVTAGLGGCGFVDAAQVSPEAKAAVEWLVSAGIVDGNDQHQLLPESGILRSEAAKVFVQFEDRYPE